MGHRGCFVNARNELWEGKTRGDEVDRAPSGKCNPAPAGVIGIAVEAIGEGVLVPVARPERETVASGQPGRPATLARPAGIP